MSNPDHPRIALQFVQPPDYRIVPATDVAGGLTPSGDVIAHFFVQHASLPVGPVVHEVQEDGTLGQPVRDGTARVPPPVVERRLQVGLLVSPATARSIGEWLLSQAEAARRLAEGGEHDGD